MSRSIKAAVSSDVLLWLSGALVVALGVPAGCLLFVLGVYLGAIVLHRLRLFNWTLWVWLVEASVLVWYFIRPGDPDDRILLVLVWSTLVLFWMGCAWVLEDRFHSNFATSLAMVLVFAQVALFVPFCLWIRDLCKIGIHICGCG